MGLRDGQLANVSNIKENSKDLLFLVLMLQTPSALPSVDAAVINTFVQKQALISKKLSMLKKKDNNSKQQTTIAAKKDWGKI